MAKKPKHRLVRTVGKNIQMRRKALGMTQQQVAEQLEIEPETVCRYERAECSPPLEQIGRLADVLKIPPPALLAHKPLPLGEQFMQACSQLPENGQVYILEIVQSYIRHHQREPTLTA
jgi:transcriptional regulator with XRE-family HTH domain